MSLFHKTFSRALAYLMAGMTAALLFCGEDSPLHSSGISNEIQPQKKEIEFFVVIPSYNNTKWCEKTLESVFCQTYQNWTLLYIDDCSKDRTGEKVDAYVKARGMEHKCTVLHNPEQRGAMANLYFAISQAPPEKVIVDLDGDGWLIDDKVFQTLADAYKDPEVWLTYGSYQIEPGMERGVGELLPEKVLQNASVRSYPFWVTSHLKTFYAGLFQKVKKEDFMIQGQFLQITSEVALFLPMLEMASHGHIRYIDRLMYVYNTQNSPSDSYRSNLQVATEFYLRSLKPYKPLDELFEQNRR